MSDTHTLPAQKREILGKQVKQLRNAGKLPANIFGDVKESVAVTLETKGFSRAYKEVGDTGIIYLQLSDEKKTRPVMVDEIATHPVKHTMLHVSLRQVDLKQKITASVPVELIGELTIQSATVNTLLSEIEVEALPTNIPESFEIDLSQFTEIGQEFSVGQLSVDASKVEVQAQADDVILQIQAVQEMAEEVVETPDVTAVETTEQSDGETATPKEGEAPATEVKSKQ